MLSDIAILCSQKKITLRELSKRCDISVSYLSLIISGKRKNISLNILSKIAKELDVPLSMLINTEDNHNNPRTYEVLNSSSILHNDSNDFQLFLQTLDNSKKELVNEIFEDYSKWLFQNRTAKFLSRNQIELLIAVSLMGGLFEVEKAKSFFPEKDFEIDRVIERKGEALILKISSEIVFETFRDKTAFVLEYLLDSYQKEMGKAEAYLAIGDLCLNNKLYDTAIIYFANAVISGFSEEKFEVFSISLEKIKKLPESSLKTLVLSWQRGVQLSHQAAYNEALETLNAVLEVPASLQIERQIKSRIFSTVGAVHLCLGNYKQGLNFFRESLRLWSKGALAGMTYINTGSLLRRIGRTRQAMIYYNEALKNKEPFVMISAYASLAQIAFDQNKLEEAREYLLRGYWCAKKSKRLTGKAEVLVNLGVYYKEKGNYKKAEELLNQGLNYAQHSNNKRTQHYAYLEITDLYLKENQIEKAQTNIEKVVEEIGDIQEILILGFWFNLKGSMYIQQREPEKALIFLKRGYHILSNAESITWELEQCVRMIEQAYINLGDPYQAGFYKGERIRIRRKRHKKRNA